MFRKLTASALLFLLVALLAQPALAATASSPLMDKLGEVETGLYGQVQPGALLPRIARVETDLFGRPTATNDAILVRIEKLAAIVTRGGVGGASLLTKLNAAEWMIFQTQTSRVPLLDRITKVEEGVYGQASTGIGIADRVDQLVALVWPGGVLNTAQVPVTPGVKVKAKLLTELKSTTSREGDEVRYQIVADVKIDNKVVIPTGSEGVGVVKQVKKAGPFGQSGQVAIEAGSVRAIDGTNINLAFQQATSDKVSQSDLAAGASLGGMVLLGPLGLAAGYLVQGKSETIPAGTELMLEVKDSAMVQGLALVPGQ